MPRTYKPEDTYVDPSLYMEPAIDDDLLPLEDEDPEAVQLPAPGKWQRNMEAKRRAEEWWEARRLGDDWAIDDYLQRKSQRQKRWRDRRGH